MLKTESHLSNGAKFQPRRRLVTIGLYFPREFSEQTCVYFEKYNDILV